MTNFKRIVVLLAAYFLSAFSAKADQTIYIEFKNLLTYPVVLSIQSTRCYEFTDSEIANFSAKIQSGQSYTLKARDDNSFFGCWKHDKILNMNLTFDYIHDWEQISDQRVRSHLEKHGYGLGRVVLKHHKNSWKKKSRKLRSKWVSYGIDETAEGFTARAWCDLRECYKPDLSKVGNVNLVTIEFDHSLESNFSH